MHVKISDTGRKLLNNRILANRILETVITNKQQLEKGEKLTVKEDNKTVSVKLVTTVKDCDSD
jgi:hypothetical protein